MAERIEPRRSTPISRFIDALTGVILGERRNPTYHQEEIVGRTREGYPHHVLVDEDGALILSLDSKEFGGQFLREIKTIYEEKLPGVESLEGFLDEIRESNNKIVEEIQARLGLVQSTLDITIPGIGTGASYASGDAFGDKFMVPVPKRGIISNVIFLDLDDEGITKELVLFDAPFTATADNATFDPTDADLRKCLGVISVDVFYNYNSNQVGVATPALGYYAPNGEIWCQVVTRGADNIAAGSIPRMVWVITE